MIAAIVCREMGWTWKEFNDEPHWFISVILGLMAEETAHQNRQNK